MPNYNPTTKRPYSVAGLNSFCDDVASELYQRAYDATMDSLNLSDEERAYAELDSVDADVTLDGVTVHVGSLSGATLVWSVDGPLQSRRAVFAMRSWRCRLGQRRGYDSVSRVPAGLDARRGAGRWDRLRTGRAAR